MKHQYILAIIVNIFKAIKYYKISKRKNDGIIHRDLKFFRDIPREENATPAEAAYLYYFDKENNRIKSKQSDVVAATILNLALKEYICQNRKKTRRAKKRRTCSL